MAEADKDGRAAEIVGDLMAATVARVGGLHDAIGASLEQFGGFLRCETCGRVENIEAGAASRYTAKGWPQCCGHTMMWWTQRQIDAGEVPFGVKP